MSTVDQIGLEKRLAVSENLSNVDQTGHQFQQTVTAA